MLRAGASAETLWSWGLAGWLRALLADCGADVVEGLLIAEFGQHITQLVICTNKTNNVCLRKYVSVSYTHLTLPTICSV